MKKEKISREKIKEIAKSYFVKELENSDYTEFAHKMNSGLIEGSLIEGLEGGIVKYGVYESRETDADPVVEYGRMTIDPYTGECHKVEIFNMEKK